MIVSRVVDVAQRRPLGPFYLIVAITALLAVFGLIMVLSASSVEGYAHTGSAYGLFTQQVIFVVLGLFLFYISLRTPPRIVGKLGLPAVVISIFLLALVLIPGIGTLSGGSRRWFVIGGFSVQPSELVKLALCVWGAHILATRNRERESLRKLLVPLVPVTVLICALIILERSLSTTITIAIIVGALLWFAGLPVRVFVSFALTAITIAVTFALMEGYRSARVHSYLGSSHDPLGAGYQARQARFALANGGLWGVGLGRSSAKWNYLPNAHNDFIFAIIAEEFGFVGGLIVVGLFLALALVGLRLAIHSVDPFLRLMTATITVFIGAQALINIGYVIGLLPVTGVQLPLLSAGGTSTLIVFLMLGLLANSARHEPAAAAALAVGGDGAIGRFFRLPKPEPYAVDQNVTRLSLRRTHQRPSTTRMSSRRNSNSRLGGYTGRRRPAAGGRSVPASVPVDPRAERPHRHGHAVTSRPAGIDYSRKFGSP